MIVGTRMPDGKIAHFDVPTDDYKVARNDVVWELGSACGLYTPVLASIPNCGRDIQKSIPVHLVKTTSKDPLKGAVEALTEAKARELALEAFIAVAEPDNDSGEDLP